METFDDGNAVVEALSGSSTPPEVEGVGNGYAARLSKPVDLIMLRRELAKVCQRELAVPGLSHTLSTSAPPDFSSLDVTLGADERQQLEYFLALGAVSDLMEWCQELAETTPARKAFAAMLYSLAEQGHFNKITQLIRAD